MAADELNHIYDRARDLAAEGESAEAVELYHRLMESNCPPRLGALVRNDLAVISGTIRPQRGN